MIKPLAINLLDKDPIFKQDLDFHCDCKICSPMVLGKVALVDSLSELLVRERALV